MAVFSVVVCSKIITTSTRRWQSLTDTRCSKSYLAPLQCRSQAAEGVQVMWAFVRRVLLVRFQIPPTVHSSPLYGEYKKLVSEENPSLWSEQITINTVVAIFSREMSCGAAPAHNSRALVLGLLRKQRRIRYRVQEVPGLLSVYSKVVRNAAALELYHMTAPPYGRGGNSSKKFR